ncbi:hypothetical protein GGQ68_002481 [Sagittula marina]|uniref:Uncharacterized protein n=1 Tax=Sagittula marina TaxID=943940 RepID=A0A7W6DU66_9RHOB|nr:class I SAM-dependent methyltransferase [Sagittula marina]MBB3986143.1 hypothetical protein [Sagittula marina]
MSKRTRTSGMKPRARIPQDRYLTFDQRATPPLRHFISPAIVFWEPCAGAYDLAAQIEAMGPRCVVASDITPGDERVFRVDALTVTREDLDSTGATHIISNTPWSRSILHRMITHFASMRPTWLLFDADWWMTKQAAPFLPMCQHIVAVGRLRWIPDTTQDGTTDCAWYLFDARHSDGPRAHGRLT